MYFQKKKTIKSEYFDGSDPSGCDYLPYFPI